jgi:hypothetical protein
MFSCAMDGRSRPSRVFDIATEVLGRATCECGFLLKGVGRSIDIRAAQTGVDSFFDVSGLKASFFPQKTYRHR